MNRKSCKGCHYHRTIGGGTETKRVCHYMLETGEKRDCSPECCNKYLRAHKKSEICK